jgi:hypothetical protein
MLCEARRAGGVKRVTLVQAPGFDTIKQFAQLERILASVLVATPALLLLVDNGPDKVRGSISAYHDVSTPQAFYFPLTVAAMLFIVNGVLKDGHWYNWVLGTFLSVVIVFDHDGASKWPHFVAAVGFFVGNVAVMIWFSKNKSMLLKVLLVGTILVSILLWVVTDWFTLFWAEWVSLAIVAVHYVLDSAGWTGYTALRKGDTVEFVPATAP